MALVDLEGACRERVGLDALDLVKGLDRHEMLGGDDPNVEALCHRLELESCGSADVRVCTNPLRDALGLCLESSRERHSQGPFGLECPEPLLHVAQELPETLGHTWAQRRRGPQVAGHRSRAPAAGWPGRCTCRARPEAIREAASGSRRGSASRCFATTSGVGVSRSAPVMKNASGRNAAARSTGARRSRGRADPLLPRETGS